MKVKVLIEGRSDEMDLPEDISIIGLLDRLELVSEAYWVARNRTMLRKTEYDQVLLVQGDTVEIFPVMSGG